ncbi:expressed protein [Chlorella variabilis]|uniref:Expressed protein n=1 Tax=Chlorella variabilis TaxID=554065 RepID=E1ZS92_CHLVA|nr:expressed protein [Chlorella variabilis]EFN51265.1 expressed protein [Chlorella variabilis]|eukprot:XP_005843367.1 expressed protein [Chlorella variabilis]
MTWWAASMSPSMTTPSSRSPRRSWPTCRMLTRSRRNTPAKASLAVSRTPPQPPPPQSPPHPRSRPPPRHQARAPQCRRAWRRLAVCWWACCCSPEPGHLRCLASGSRSIGDSSTVCRQCLDLFGLPHLHRTHTSAHTVPPSLRLLSPERVVLTNY